MRTIPSLGLAALALTASLACAAQTPATSGTLRLGGQAQRANPAGPLAAANALVPGIAPLPAGSTLAQAELRSRWRILNMALQLDTERPDGGPTRSHARINELYGTADLAAWQLSAGKQVVSWDVGYAWRPNDLVQQEPRRQLGPVVLEGRPLLQLEHFDAERATSLVWVNPQRQSRPSSAQLGPDESALAVRYYQRLGALDAYAFARAGQHSRASLGAAAAWVASEALELHGSLRWSQRHDGWQLDPAASGAADLAPSTPWQPQTLGPARQALLGLTWTDAAQHSLLLEGWWDGSAPADADWQRWTARTAALQTAGATPGLPAATRIGTAAHLAWQTTPLAGQNLRRRNLYLRAAWQPEAWTLAADLLVTPSDAGHAAGLSARWQGDRVSVELAWRRYGGPAEALYRQLPSRQVSTLTGSWSF